ncbi:FAD-dependent oxidoreductase [Martelella mediterranea]|uniref:NAD(P)/FAD-dependent oxidoreductase n=1 Tax=Martelella mediterranea TaxID=293089 RepID=UPI001E2B3E22|nr:FAD-dependent oxidoreductase [Martelella mediterranea]MCD1635999.1 FAD-dependent oxidoreductase [Martelella mediterranea]
MHHPQENAYRKLRADRKVAVIGSGISGLSAAWLLSRSCHVTLFEADDRPGGHSNTADVAVGDRTIPVDTGFIVYNERNYPNLTAMFSYLGVETEASEMSFSASLDNGAFEYGGSNIATLLAQKSNILRFSFWRMVYDIFRFYRHAPAAARSEADQDLTLGDYLDARGYSKRFVRDHILPMGAAIWSTTPEQMRAYPLAAFTRFFESHGLLTLVDRPQWRTVTGGSRSYVTRMLEQISGPVRLNTPVERIVRDDSGVRLVAGGTEQRFDAVVVATHGDQALRLLDNPAEEERNLLSAFRYTTNEAWLHSDERLMPAHRKVWSSWNYLERRDRGTPNLCVTYWMNRLQNIDERVPLFVTLNPCEEIRPELVHQRYTYMHPLFDKAAIDAQRDLWRIQGQGNVWYCGAHFGSGFHEDGLQSGLAAAEAIAGVRRPWNVEDESGRIFLEPERVAAE